MMGTQQETCNHDGCRLVTQALTKDGRTRKAEGDRRGIGHRPRLLLPLRGLPRLLTSGLAGDGGSGRLLRWRRGAEAGLLGCRRRPEAGWRRPLHEVGGRRQGLRCSGGLTDLKDSLGANLWLRKRLSLQWKLCVNGVRGKNLVTRHIQQQDTCLQRARNMRRYRERQGYP